MLVGGAAVCPQGPKVLRGSSHQQLTAASCEKTCGQGAQEVIGPWSSTTVQQQPCHLKVLDKRDALQEAVVLFAFELQALPRVTRRRNASAVVMFCLLLMMASACSSMH